MKVDWGGGGREKLESKRAEKEKEDNPRDNIEWFS